MSAKAPELDQRFGLFKRYHFVLEEDGIRVSIRTLQVKRRYLVPLMTILETPSEETTGSRRLLWSSGALWIATALVSWMYFSEGKAEWQAPWMWGAAALLASSLYWLSRQSYYAFSIDDYPLIFIRNKPSSAAVDAFVARAQTAARTRVRQQVIAEASDHQDLLQRLKWLRENKIVDQAEYTVLRQQARAERDSMPDEPSEPGLH
ncbi:MAG: hypothetical protein ACOY0T_22895 [Myxococcota bacterium]